MNSDELSRARGAAGMRSSETASSPDPGDRELVFTRLFDAPRRLVYRAWTDPEQVVHWYGPKGFTVTFLEMDVRVGGAWRKCMRSPDGVDYWRSGIYREIVEFERLVFTYVSDDPHGIRGHETLVTIDFADQGKKTLMTFRQAVFESVATRNSHRGGWGESMERFTDWVEGRRG